MNRDVKRATVIQGPHCLIDAPCGASLTADQALDLMADLVGALEMKQLGEARIVRGAASPRTFPLNKKL